MRKYWNVSGYFKDDKTEFSDYIVTNFNDATYDDEDIFFYGITEDDMRLSHEDDALDFVITSFKLIESI
jgi:hypothetical protein